MKDVTREDWMKTDSEGKKKKREMKGGCRWGGGRQTDRRCNERQRMKTSDAL